MKNIYISIGLITILSGCGATTEDWKCVGKKSTSLDAIVSIDLSNKTMLVDERFGTSINLNGNKVIYTSSTTNETAVFDRSTGKFYVSGNLLRECEKI